MKLIKLGALLSLMLMFIGCNDENPWQGVNAQGRISPTLKTDCSVKEVAPLSRANDPSAPTADKFKLSLTKEDGTYSESWESVSEFPMDKNYSVGAYTMEASYGSIDEEGFEKPYYYGSSDLIVKEAETTDVTVTAKLANAMVSIDYTDAFKKYFKGYTTQIHSKGGDFITFTSNETRPAYVCPGQMSLIVNLTKQNGVSATFEPAMVTTEAQHHYHIKFDVNEGEIGEAKLVISFDESLSTDNVVLDLSDELMISPAPEVEADGFTVGDPVDILEGEKPESPLKFNIVARGGLKQATLTTQSAQLIAQGWPTEIDLIAATPAQQSLLKQQGLNTVGLWKNPDKMASIDFSNVFASIKESGRHTFTLVVKDKLSKVNEPISLIVDTENIDLAVVKTETSMIGVNEAVMTLSYNGKDIQKNITIEAMTYGVYEQCEIFEISEATRSAANYVVRFALPESNAATINIKLKYKGEEKTSAVIVREAPAYEIQADAFAKKMIIKIIPEDTSKLEMITNMANIYVNNAKTTKIARDVKNGYITVTGLTPATVYSIKSTLMDGGTGSAFSNTLTTTTEVDADVTNGSFGNVTRTIDSGTINAGGQYGETAVVKYRSKSSILINEPQGWASINAKTCYLGASNKNTWFCVPSTMATNGTVTIRSVAYDHNGKDPSFDSGRTAFGDYYSRKAPESFAYRSSGELFLGSYSFNGTETRSEGVAFASRPTSLSFDYQYAAYNNDKGSVVVNVLDSKGSIIASATREISNQTTMSNVVLQLSSYAYGTKAAKLQIKFMSSKGTVQTYVPTGSELKDVNGTVGNTTIDANKYKSLSVGSVLVIDNVKLNY